MDASVTGIPSTDTTYSTQTAELTGATGTSSAQASDQAGTPKTTGSTAPKQDDVKISAAAEAQSLYQQGQTVKEIAQYLGCTTKVVDTYLGITDSTATTTSSGSVDGKAQYSSSQVAQLLANM
jgi:hypothetical protein